MVFIMFAFVGCDYIVFPVLQTTQTSTALPTKINGTITFEESDYDSLPIFHSDTYDLNDIEEYNDILFNTKDNIRRSNILVNMVLYTQSLPWASEKDRNVMSSGSGFIFLEDDDYYYAITNYHVIDDNEENLVLEIQAYDDTDFYDATVVTFDADIDLAVIKFAKEERTEIRVIDIYARLYYKFNPGELVLAVGNPSSLTNNVTFGEYKAMETLNDVNYKVIYHDASISNGSSGGALVDVDGNFLGVNTWGLEDSDEYSFAIPNYIVYIFLINNGILD
jgi:S1-C subfamily serine protease